MNNSNAAPFKPLVATAAYYASYIILGATIALLGPSLPWLAENTASRLDQISLIFAASSFGYMTGSLLGGRIYDRLSGHRIQALALLLISVGATIVPVIPTLWVLVGIVFILGNLQGALDTGCNTLLNWIFQEKGRSIHERLAFLLRGGSLPGADRLRQGGGDGRPDIAWRHASSGRNVVWLMNGTTRTSGVFTTPDTVADTNWLIAGTGDFNADGQQDLIWRQAVSGNVVVWLMNGTVRTAGTFINPPSLADPNWQMAAVGDFSQDGQPDILWRHAVSARTVLSEMDGLSRSYGLYTTPDAPRGLNWNLVGPR